MRSLDLYSLSLVPLPTHVNLQRGFSWVLEAKQFHFRKEQSQCFHFSGKNGQTTNFVHICCQMYIPNHTYAIPNIFIMCEESKMWAPHPLILQDTSSLSGHHHSSGADRVDCILYVNFHRVDCAAYLPRPNSGSPPEQIHRNSILANATATTHISAKFSTKHTGSHTPK